MIASRKSIIALSLATVSSSCVTTQEMPLAPNIVRLDTHASGLLSTGQAVPQTMRKAAQATLDNGYTHFKLQNVETQQGERLAGVCNSSSANASVNGFGDAAIATGTASGFSTPIYRRTADVGVTVVMFRANDSGAKDAFDAGEVLKKYAQ